MKEYFEPEMEIVTVEQNDIVTSSSCPTEYHAQECEGMPVTCPIAN